MDERGQFRGEQYARLHEMGDLRVSPEDPDPTGWAVIDRSGQRVGTVDELIVDTAAMKVRYLEIELDDAPTRDEHLLVDIDEIDLLDQQHQAVLRAMGRDDLRGRIGERRGRAGARDVVAQTHDRGEAGRITRAEEELRIGKREAQAGEVVVGKHVETEHVTKPVERKVERVRVERRPVTGDQPAEAKFGEREMRVPIMEEDVVVEKRPVVKEEIVVSKTTDTETENVETDVRKERFDVQGEGNVTEDTGGAPRNRPDRPDRGGRRG